MVRLRPRESALVRCAFCHGALDGLRIVCSSCGTLLHDDCATGRCPTLGCRSTVQSEPSLWRRAGHGWATLWVDYLLRYRGFETRVALAFLAVVLIALLVLIVFAEGSAYCAGPTTIF